MMEMVRPKERIMFAACKRGDRIWTGKRHNEIIMHMMEDGEKPPFFITEQGFITSTGRFVDRYEAAEVAIRAGQVTSHVSCLSSEDVW